MEQLGGTTTFDRFRFLWCTKYKILVFCITSYILDYRFYSKAENLIYVFK